MSNNKSGINPATNQPTNQPTFHCLFEQSGTFKNEFKKLGYEAYDYDILNDFGETDFQIDLFDEIANAARHKPSVFDKIKVCDVTLAFFPCTMFQENNALIFSGKQNQIRNKSLAQKMDIFIERHQKLNLFYTRLCQMTKIYAERGLKLVIENPATPPHYLTTYWIASSFTDKDRRKNGDHFKKPTQFWFINCEPQNNFLFEPIEYVETKRINHMQGSDRTVQRSMIHPQYANRFIRQHILEE